MSTELAIRAREEAIDHAVQLATAGLAANTQRAYARTVRHFLDYLTATGQSFSKAAVANYKQFLIDDGLAPATVNQRLATLRRLVRELADDGQVDELTAQAIARVKSVKQQGRRLGRWLNRDEARRLLSAPNDLAIKGKRDKAILSVMIGAGLRRSEVAALRVEQLQRSPEGWVIKDIRGKGGRVRSVAIRDSYVEPVHLWLATASISGGFMFRRIRRGGHVQDAPMTAQAVADVVRHYGRLTGLAPLAAHDLRRTFAELARQNGSTIHDIQKSLGHASAVTTERYLDASAAGNAGLSLPDLL